MLLYHFPLNTQENIEGFVNNGMKNDFALLNNNIVQVANNGIVSNKCANPNGDKLSIDLSLFDEFSFCFRFYAASNFIGGTSFRTIVGININTTQNNPTCSLFTTANSANYSFSGSSYNGTFDNKWHSIVVTKKSTTIKVYVNSTLITTGTFSDSARYICLWGRYSTNSYNIDTLTQDIRIYDYTLSQAEINEYSRAMVVHYPLNGNVLGGNVIRDCSGFGNDTFESGSKEFDYVYQSPRYALQADFSGDKNQYKVGKLLNLLNNFSVSFWINVKSLSDDQYVFSQGRNWIGSTNDNFGFNIGVYANGNINVKIGDLSVNVQKIEINRQYFIATVYSDGMLYMYVNGLLVKSSKVTTPPEYKSSNTPNVFCVGKIAYGYNNSVNGYYPANSKISDLRVYATALSAEDIKNLYNAPIHLDKQHTLQCSEVVENAKYPSKYWHTPTYDEMNYLLNTRTNASNLRTLCRVEVSSGTYVNGCFLLPDDWVLPDGLTMTITTANYTTNNYSLADFKLLEDNGAVFLVGVPIYRAGTTIRESFRCGYSVGTGINEIDRYCFYFSANNIEFSTSGLYVGRFVRLCRSSFQPHSFSTSATTAIKFAHANLQYHCTQHIWRFAEHQYDFIGADNTNISDSYNGWIDLFGYGTSGVNHSPTLHATNNADYASGDITNTDNDWGINEIQSYDYNVKNFALNKNGIVQHNELRENDSDVNGCYNDKLITNELIEN